MDDAADELAMFPLGTVLLPQATLPLRLFEPRYLEMFESIWTGVGVFGSVLIERGPEVGGGDVRSPIGCRAELLDAAPGADNDIFVVARGTARFEVAEWLDDDPYPRARVRDLPEGTAEPADVVHQQLVHALEALLVAVGNTDDAGIATILDTDDVVERAYRIANALPLGPLDAYGVLAAENPEKRALLLIDAIEGFTTIATTQLGE